MSSNITIYRIENPETMNGMWYNNLGDYDPVITSLSEGISKDLPMDFNNRYGQKGRRWYSGCTEKRQMRQWFSPRDVFELYSKGYELFSFEANEYQIEEHQTIFTREGVLTRKAIEVVDLWPELTDFGFCTNKV